MNWEALELAAGEREGVVVGVGVMLGTLLSMEEWVTMDMMPPEVPEGEADGDGEGEGEAEAEGEAEEAAEAAGMELLGALSPEGAALAPGMVMGTPTDLQVASTAAMAFCWSAAEQAPWAQGWTWERS